MDLLQIIFGDGDSLNAWQMSARALVTFLYTLILVRISGRRSFGMRAPLDNIVLILLGAILGRAVVGASPYIPTLIAGLVITILHRVFALLSLKLPLFERFAKGDKILLYKNGRFIPAHLKRSLISEEDLMQEVRIHAQVDSLDQVKAVYMEKNGEISTVKK